MRLLFPLFMMTFCCSAAFAQDMPTESGRNQAVYLELLGNGLVGSINYDMRLSRNRQDGHGLRVGIGGFPIRGWDAAGNRVKGTAIMLPISYNYLIGKRRSAFEMGAGITPVFGRVKGVDFSGDEVGDAEITTLGFLNAGYRYQPLNSGFVFRFTWTPGISNTGLQPFWFGLSLGYGFK